MSNYIKLLSVTNASDYQGDIYDGSLKVQGKTSGGYTYQQRVSKNVTTASMCCKVAYIQDYIQDNEPTYRLMLGYRLEDMDTLSTDDKVFNYVNKNVTLDTYIQSGSITRGGLLTVSTSGDVIGTYYGGFWKEDELNGGIPRINSSSSETWQEFLVRVLDLMDDGSWTNAPDTPSDLNDKTSGEEGYGDTGDHDHTSDTIGIPDEPSLGVTTAGFIRAYNPTQAQLDDLGVVLFPPSPTQATDAVEAILAVAAGLYNSKLIDYVVDVHVIPVTPQVGGAENIFCGNVNTYVASNRVTSDYVDFSCGSINVGECYGNYIDYMTRGRLFLPFVGFVDLKPEYWQSGTLTVDYRFNIVDGSFMAFVRSTSSKSQLSDTVIGQYGGNCCTHFPLTGLNYSSMLSGLITGSMQLAAAVGAGSPVGVATSAATMLNQKPSVSQSNNYNASTSFLGVRRPYLLLERPVPNFAAYYNHDRGLPLNVTYQLIDLSGFTTIPEIDLSSLSCTEKEKAELSRLFAEGVYF